MKCIEMKIKHKRIKREFRAMDEKRNGTIKMNNNDNCHETCN